MACQTGELGLFLSAAMEPSYPPLEEGNEGMKRMSCSRMPLLSRHWRASSLEEETKSTAAPSEGRKYLVFTIALKRLREPSGRKEEAGSNILIPATWRKSVIF